MNGYELYCHFVAIRNHFHGSSYDYGKYGPSKVKFATFEKRKDRYLFEKLAKKIKTEDVPLYIASNMLNNSKLWITDMFDQKCTDVFFRRKKVCESLRYTFNQDLQYLLSISEEKRLSFRKLLLERPLPMVVQCVMSGSISVETLVILDLITKFSRFHETNTDLLWKEFGEKNLKFRAFVPTISSAEYSKLILNTFKQENKGK